jgi:ABC-type uncharacterized transport system permease subunit
MSDRGFLFIFSILMILGGLGTAVWLFVSGQADTVDGLFMVLTALLVAAAFALYVKFMIGRAKEEVAKSATQPAKAAASPASKPTPATVSQS